MTAPLDGIPTLAEALNGKFKAFVAAGPRRVHRFDEGEIQQDNPRPEIRAFGRPQEGTVQKPTKLKRKPAPQKVTKAGNIVGAATFAIDDTGHLAILDGQQRINLERDDVKRLAAFLGRTKGLRA